MEKLSEYGEEYRRILTYFLKKNGIYDMFVGNTVYFHTERISQNNTLRRRQYYNPIFNQAAWERDGLVNLFSEFFSFTSTKYPKHLGVFGRFAFWTDKNKVWENFIYKREYEEITTLK